MYHFHKDKEEESFNKGIFTKVLEMYYSLRLHRVLSF